MKANHGTFSVVRMARVFSVSPSGFYAWKQACTQPSQQKIKRQQRDEQIKLAFDNSKQRDGARRIKAELEEQGDKHDVKTISNSMRMQNLVAKAARKFKVTTDSKHNLPTAPNVLEQNFTASKPNQKWAGDITYLMTSEG